MKASWNGRHFGLGSSISGRFCNARATARLATRKASRASSSAAKASMPRSIRLAASVADWISCSAVSRRSPASFAMFLPLLVNPTAILHDER